MILHEEYKDEILSYIKELPEKLFSQSKAGKEEILADNHIIDLLWIHYQKEVEEYGCDSEFSLLDTVREILCICTRKEVCMRSECQ